MDRLFAQHQFYSPRSAQLQSPIIRMINNLFLTMDHNYRIEVLEVEKLKLLEEVDYLNQTLQQQANEYCDQLLQTEQKLIDIQLQLNQAEQLNQELLLKMQGYRKNEDQLNNANMNFVALQKRCDQLLLENQSLQQKLLHEGKASGQFQQKWQRVSQQLKLATQRQTCTKALEQELERKTQLIQEMKEKNAQLSLELMVHRQSEQEYKQSVAQKIQQLMQQLTHAQQNQTRLQQVLTSPPCSKCLQLQQEISQLKQLVNADGIQVEQNRINQQINSQLSQQVQDQYNRILELELQNHNLAQKLQQALSVTPPLIQPELRKQPKNFLSQNQHYIKLQKLIDSIPTPNLQELCRRTLSDFTREMDLRDNVALQLQECRTMYDRLLVKYYSLQRTLGVEQESAPRTKEQTWEQDSPHLPHFTLQKRPNLLIQQQDTTKQVKQPHLSNTPKQIKKREFQSSAKQYLSLDSSGYQDTQKQQF